MWFFAILGVPFQVAWVTAPRWLSVVTDIGLGRVAAAITRLGGHDAPRGRAIATPVMAGRATGTISGAADRRVVRRRALGGHG